MRELSIGGVMVFGVVAFSACLDSPSATLKLDSEVKPA